MEASEGLKKAKHRSPAYPAIDLEKALDQAKRLWDVAGKHAAPLESAMKAWGYSAKSSGGLQTVAALKQYGLASDRGSGWGREVTLSKVAQEFLVYEKDSPEWKQRAGVAALRPKIHRELWEKYEGSLPDNSVILPYLVLDRGFSDAAARDMLKRFRKTIAFAQVSDTGATLSENGSESDEDSGEKEEVIVPPASLKEDKSKERSHAPKGGREKQERTIQVTYSPTAWALVQGEFPMNEADWQSFIAVLQAMKPGLVVSDE